MMSDKERGILYIPRVKAPEGFSERVMAKILKMSAAHPRLYQKYRIPFAMAAAIILSFGLGLASSFFLKPQRILSTTTFVRFSLYSPEAREVSLVGDFNTWSTHEDLLTPVGNGVWSITIPLPPGRYKYMFLVDGKNWMSDPRASHHIDDGFGRMNAVLDLS